MKLIWTKSTLPLSLVIRAITGQDCSHFAFVFESTAESLAFESNLLGCHPIFLQDMTSGFGGAVIVHQMDIPLTEDQEDIIWDVVVDKYGNAPSYDFTGALYLGWRCLLKRLFNMPIPEKNAWAKAGTYYCDELYNILTQIPSVPQIQVAGAMKTPHDLWVALQGGTT